jgi:hypothetical protein
MERRILWNQFILAAALARSVRTAIGRAAPADQDGESPDGEFPGFSYTDTHAGSGHIAGPLPLLDRVRGDGDRFANRAFFDALSPPLPEGRHPGSWLLAGRVALVVDERVGLELDVNDLDAGLIAEAGGNREGGWVRFWSHDWFLFLRSRLAMAHRPDFVFIDPPPDDARGPAYAIDAAILLDTLKVPYMVSYPVHSPQDPIDQIGRTGLELHGPGAGCGVLLGGGGESVLLDILPDLRHLATVLGGDFHVRLPRSDDYSI